MLGKFDLKLFQIFVIHVLLLSSCASFGPTKPNPVFQGPYPTKYYELDDEKPLLAQELGKLPELQDGISASEASALEQIVEIHKEISKEFNDAFDKMYQVGKPEIRKHCSPLQAVFWLVESERADDARGILKHYSLEELLHIAWPSKKSVLTECQTLDIIDGIKNEHDRKEYEEWYSRIGNSKKIWSELFTDYLVEPDKFSEKGQRILAKLMKPPELFKEEAWKDFDTVVERLNAPELLDHYINNNFRKTLGGKGFINPPAQVFRVKHGFCEELAKFGIHVLKRAGYNGKLYWDMRVPIKPYAQNALSGHTIAAYEEDALMRIFVDWRPGSRNYMYCVDKQAFKKRFIPK